MIEVAAGATLANAYANANLSAWNAVNAKTLQASMSYII